MCVCVDHYHIFSFFPPHRDGIARKKTLFSSRFLLLRSFFSSFQSTSFRTAKRFPFDKFTDFSKGMADMIKKEMKELRLAKVGGNEEFKPKGQFVLVGGVYIYHHWKSAHAACSKVTATHPAAFGVSFEIKQEKLLNCRNDDHLVLEPYFKCNEYVLDVYQEKVSTASGEVKLGLMKDIELLKSKNPQETEYTLFYEPSLSVYDWHENDWTYRLCYGMKRLFPHARIHYTAEDGLQWNTKVLPKVLDVDQKLADCFLLRGAPDIVINSNKLISTANPGVAEEESS